MQTADIVTGTQEPCDATTPLSYAAGADPALDADAELLTKPTAQ